MGLLMGAPIENNILASLASFIHGAMRKMFNSEKIEGFVNSTVAEESHLLSENVKVAFHVYLLALKLIGC